MRELARARRSQVAVTPDEGRVKSAALPPGVPRTLDVVTDGNGEPTCVTGETLPRKQELGEMCDFSFTA